MATAVELPALDGRDPLGFLAALGLHTVVADELGRHVGLSFSDTTGNAVLHSDLHSTRAVAALLENVVSRAGDDTAIVGIDDRFPLRPNTRARTASDDPAGEGDPMRVPREQFRDLVEKVAKIDEKGVRWLSVLVTDMAIDAKGRAALTPYCAPSGKQNLRTFFFKPLQSVRKEPWRLREALEGWTRVDNFTGEYLDHRVIRDAAHHPRGKSVEAGVPGATWLATQALPMLRLTGDGQRVKATLWHTHGRRQVMIWPLWRQPLNTLAVQVLLEHPQLRPQTWQGPTQRIEREPLNALGIFTIHGAERQPVQGRKSAGVLAPIPINH